MPFDLWNNLLAGLPPNYINNGGNTSTAMPPLADNSNIPGPYNAIMQPTTPAVNQQQYPEWAQRYAKLLGTTPDIAWQKVEELPTYNYLLNTGIGGPYNELSTSPDPEQAEFTKWMLSQPRNNTTFEGWLPTHTWGGHLTWGVNPNVGTDKAIREAIIKYNLYKSQLQNNQGANNVQR